MPGTEPLLRRSLVLAAAALLLQALLVFMGGRVADTNAARLGNYVRFDGVHYLTIATEGYRVGYCGPDNTMTPIIGEPRPGGLGVYCGNTGWFPGWSAMVAGLTKVGVNAYWAAGLVSWSCRALCLWAIAAWLLRRKVPDDALHATLLAAAAFPGSVYFVAAFPLSLAVLTLMLVIDGCRRESFLIAAAAGFCTSFSYSSGWLGPAAIGAYLLFEAARQRRWRLFWLSGTVVGAALVGVLAVFAIMQWQTGHWQAYFLLQSIYEHHFGPANALAHVVTSVQTVVAAPFTLDAAKDWQTIAVFAWLLLTAAVVLRDHRRQEATVMLALAAAALCWLFPKMMGAEGNISQVRYESLLLPLVCAFPQLPRAARWTFAGAFVLLTPFTTAEFFLNLIV